MTKLPFERPVIQKINAGIPSKYGIQGKIQPINNIDGVLINEMLEKYGSPLYVFSEATIRKTYKDAYRAFSTRYPQVQFAWSYKTNYLNAICHVFHQEGSWAEVVSGFEYSKAIANGVPPENIIFNGPYKTSEDLMIAINNASLIHIDHFDEMYEIIRLSSSLKNKPRVSIRVK